MAEQDDGRTPVRFMENAEGRRVRVRDLGHRSPPVFGETTGSSTGRRGRRWSGLLPIICVGERLEERERGRDRDVVLGQVRGTLAGMTAGDLERVVLAYEPVWAIGTGKTATPDQAQEVHSLIRRLIAEMFGPMLAPDSPYSTGEREA